MQPNVMMIIMPVYLGTYLCIQYKSKPANANLQSLTFANTQPAGEPATFIVVRYLITNTLITRSFDYIFVNWTPPTSSKKAPSPTCLCPALLSTPRATLLYLGLPLLGLWVCALTIPYPVFKPSVVQESEVSVSVYSFDNKAAKHTSIPVTEADGRLSEMPVIPQANEMQVLSTLSKDLFGKICLASSIILLQI